MVICVLYPSLFSENLTPLFRNLRVPRGRNGARFMANSRESSQSPTKLVTFLGKGGSGKTTAAVLAAKYYASEGLRTCLVIHSQDPTAEQLMGCKIGSAPTECSDNLSAVQLETSKMILEPLNRMKKVDARLNLTQGVLQGVVGEELGVLPGMDSIFSALALQKLVNFHSDERNAAPKEFDMVIYDGISTEETLRLIGVTERARWYLKYMRSMSEKTDIGRLTSPSLLKLAYDSINLNSGISEGKTSTDIWNEVEQILERASASFTDSSKFRCYLVMDPMRSVSISSALRYWGCAIQAGTHICGALGFNPQSYAVTQEVAEKFSPLSFALLPYIGTDPFVEWETKLDSLDQSTKDLLGANIYFRPSVTFDSLQKTVTLFMPGFDKSEVKLYQYRGGSELLVEAGDQRRIIKLPPHMHGKVIGAKFTDRNLVVKLR